MYIKIILFLCILTCDIECADIPNDICEEIDFGVLPHPNDCIKFIVCINESINVLNCGANEVFYDGICVKGDPDTCAVFTMDTETTITTKEPTRISTTTATDDTTSSTTTAESICSGINFGLLPHPNDCTLFIVFSNGHISSVNVCPAPTLVFHNGSCVIGNPETCEIGPITTSTTSTEEPTTTTTTPKKPTTTTTTEVPQFCAGIIFEMISHPNDCTKFIFCVDEISTVFSCPDSIPIFYNGTCTAGDPETCEVLPSTTTTSTTTTTKNPNICHGIIFEILPHPDDCTKYVYCINGIPFINSCEYPTAVFYNGTCVAGDPTTCEVFNETTTTEEPTTPEIPDDFCEGINFGVFPHPNDCTKFVVCIYEISLVNKCHEEAPVFYNGTCIEGNPETCEIITTITPARTTTNDPTTTSITTTTTENLTTSSTTTTTKDPISSICDEIINFEIFPHPDNCTMFIACMNQVATVSTCPYLTPVFVNGTCVAGDPDTCEIYPPTTTTTTKRSTGPVELCK